MPWAAAAAVAGAYISSDSSRSAANKQADAARDASATQAGAADRANQTQMNMQQTALNFERQQTDPYTTAGNKALATYMNQLGMRGKKTPFDPSMVPGYDFMKSEALNSLNNSASATTGALSGNAQKALVDRISGLASTQYGSYLDRISGLVSLGENAGVNSGNAGVGIVQNAANNISANQMTLGSQIGGNLIGAGNAQAAAQIASGNAWGSAANTIFGNQQTQKSLSSLFSSPSSSSSQSPDLTGGEYGGDAGGFTAG